MLPGPGLIDAVADASSLSEALVLRAGLLALLPLPAGGTAR
jgi:hypothetical protein